MSEWVDERDASQPYLPCRHGCSRVCSLCQQGERERLGQVTFLPGHSSVPTHATNMNVGRRRRVS